MSKKIPYRLIEQEKETNHLVIILPGAGYSTQAPLLYYSTSLFYNKGFDILHINYSFSRQEMSELNGGKFAQDVQSVIEEATKDKDYSHTYLVAKSIGTIALSYLVETNFLKEDTKLVWLTPLLQRDDVFTAMVGSHNKGLCYIGDQDPCYIEDRFEKLRTNQTLELRLIGGGDHRLEVKGGPLESIEVVKGMITELDHF